jgi:hypothetical protein
VVVAADREAVRGLIHRAVAAWSADRACSVGEPPQHRANPVQRGVDCAELGRRDVAARPCDAQRRGELAGRASGAAEQVGAVEAGTLSRFADVERDRLSGAADLVGERLAALADSWSLPERVAPAR